MTEPDVPKIGGSPHPLAGWESWNMGQSGQHSFQLAAWVASIGGCMPDRPKLRWWQLFARWREYREVHRYSRRIRKSYLDWANKHPRVSTFDTRSIFNEGEQE